LIRWAKSLRAVGLVLLTALAAVATAADAPGSRIEARSANLLAVGIVQGDHMSIHLSRLLDNAPVHDAVVSVALRGTVHPTVAEADGSYTLRTPDLSIPGSAAVSFQVAQGTTHEDLNGTLSLADSAPKTEDKNSARQLWWWVLNFAVCIGFLKLWSQRRKNASDD
jgi:hypothetical protein